MTQSSPGQRFSTAFRASTMFCEEAAGLHRILDRRQPYGADQLRVAYRGDSEPAECPAWLASVVVEEKREVVAIFVEVKQTFDRARELVE